MVKIQTHRGHSLGQGAPDRTMAQKLHLEPSPAPSQVAPNLKVPCKKRFGLAKHPHGPCFLSTLLPIPREIFTPTPKPESSCPPPRQHQKLRSGPRSSPGGHPRPSPSPPTAEGTAGCRPGAPRMERRQSCNEDAGWLPPFGMCRCGTERAQPSPRCRPGSLRFTCPCRLHTPPSSPQSPSHPACDIPPL